MIQGWLRVVLGGLVVAVGAGALVLVFFMGGSRRLTALAFAIPVGLALIVWGLFEVVFKVGKGLFGEASHEAHPMGVLADSMLFVATADGAPSDSEIQAILRILNEVHRADVPEKRVRARAKLLLGKKARESFNWRLAGAKRFDDIMLHDIATGIVEVVKADQRPERRTAAVALAVVDQMQPTQATRDMVALAIGPASN